LWKVLQTKYYIKLSTAVSLNTEGKN